MKNESTKILSEVYKSNLELFLETYKKNLKLSRETHPDMYHWNISELDQVFERMKAAILKRSFNKDSDSFKRTCKELKIKHTYKDIESFIYNT